MKLLTRTAARVISLKDKVATPTICEGAGLEVLLLGEDKLERAVGVGAAGRDIKTEDGADVIRGEDAVVLVPKGLIGLQGRYLGDVVRELKLAGREQGWAVGPRVQGVGRPDPFVRGKGPLGDEVKRGRESGGDKQRQ
jgi:hypothetical protein